MALDEKVSVAVASFRAVHRAHRRERLPVLSSSSVEARESDTQLRRAPERL